MLVILEDISGFCVALFDKLIISFSSLVYIIRSFPVESLLHSPSLELSSIFKLLFLF